MSKSGEWLRRFATLARRRSLEAGLDAEMALHADLRAEQTAADGVPRDAARLEARRRFGSALRAREDSRDAWGWTILDELAQDVRYAARSLARSPAFAAAALLSLALGIGANAVVFSLLSGVILRPLPFPDPERLVHVNGTAPGLGLTAVPFADLDEYREQSRSFVGFAAFTTQSAILQGSGAPERIATVTTDRELFPLLSVPAAQGRTFTPDDRSPVVVCSTGFARRWFGGEAAAVGRELRLDGKPYTVIGVMPPDFEFPLAGDGLRTVGRGTRVDVWMAWDQPEIFRQNRRIRSDFVLARLKPDTTIDAARQDLASVARTLADRFPETNRDRGVALTPLREKVVGASRPRLLLLMSAVGLVLLVTCANLTNLLLVRGSSREREFAIRASIGAARARLIRQLLTEALVLALAGSALALFVTRAAIPIVLSGAAAEIPRAWDIGIDWRVLLFLVVAAGATAVLFGLAPAVAASRTDLDRVLRGSGTGVGTAGGARRLRDVLAAVEIALAFVLLAAAVIVARELLQLQQTPNGMRTANVITMHIRPQLTPDQYYALARDVEQLPDVSAAGMTQYLPLQNWDWTGTFVVAGSSPGEGVPRPLAELRYVTPGYFRTMGMTLQRGRGFTDDDRANTERVIVVNEALVRLAFPNQNPIGRRLDRGTIVGVIGDVRQARLNAPAVPEIYYPMTQSVSQRVETGMTLVAQTRVPPESTINEIRGLIQRQFPEAAVFDVMTMDAVVGNSLADVRLYTWLIATFAALATLLACAGIFGVVSYSVATRRRDYGIRLALGAAPSRLVASVFGYGATLVGAGLLAGAGGALAVHRLVDRLLLPVEGLGAWPLLATALVLAAAAQLACAVPAWRVSRLDPMTTLRTE